jgi:hypothetical protein
MTTANLFPIPSNLSPTLARVKAYWETLRRAGNKIPFWDDLNLSALPDISSKLLLIDVFSGPERFRFNIVGQDLTSGEADLRHGFLDELSLTDKLVYLRAQASATVEASQPTFVHLQLENERGFDRLLLPMWGNGEISMLLGVAD